YLERTARREPGSPRPGSSRRRVVAFFLTVGTGGGNSAPCGLIGLYRASFCASGSGATVRTRLRRAMIKSGTAVPTQPTAGAASCFRLAANKGEPRNDQSESAWPAEPESGPEARPAATGRRAEAGPAAAGPGPPGAEPQPSGPETRSRSLSRADARI